MPWPSTTIVPRELVPVARSFPDAGAGAEDVVGADPYPPPPEEVPEHPASVTMDRAAMVTMSGSRAFMV
jgi:hypothetical protein